MSIIDRFATDAIVVGINGLGLSYACASLGIRTRAVAAVDRLMPNFAPSPNATVTTSQAISLLWNWLTNSGDPIEPANVSPVLTPLAPEQVAYHLTPPNTQGDFDHVQEAGRAIGQAAHGARLALFITEKVTFDTFVERVRRQSRERETPRACLLLLCELIVYHCDLLQSGATLLEAIPHLPNRRVQLAHATIGGKSVILAWNDLSFDQGDAGCEIGFVVRALAKADIGNVLFVSTVASADEAVRVGDLALVSDHVCFAGHSPLSGHNEDRWGLRFVDVSDLYSAAMRSAFQSSAHALWQAPLPETVAVKVTGPIFHSHLDAKLVRTLHGSVRPKHAAHISLSCCCCCCGSHLPLASSCVCAQSVTSRIAPEAITARHMRITSAALVLVDSAIHEHSEPKSPIPFDSDKAAKAFELVAHAIEHAEFTNKYQ